MSTTTWAQCQGCNKVFTTQQGLVQHIAKTKHLLCCVVNAALQTPTALQFFPNIGHPLIFDMNPGHPLTSDVNPAPPDSQEVEVSSYKIAGADEGNILQSCADFFTNPPILDDTINDPDHDNSINSVPDTADSDDADAFEILTNGITGSVVAVPEEVPPAELAEATQLLPDPLIQAEKANLEPTSKFMITRFLHGSPGTLLPGVAQGSTAYQSSQAALDSSVWAPFCSKLDWKITCWAKTCGQTLSAMTELLAIPGVCGPCLGLMIYLHIM